MARALDAQQEFVADASHHLRTPLTALRLRLEGLQASNSDKATTRQVDAATAELDRLSWTIDELLILGTTGERDAPRESVAIATAARAAVARWEPAAAERDQELVLVERRPGTTVWASKADVERALDVLVDNALRYAPASSTVDVAVDDNAIDILDRGRGLSVDDAARVFDRLRRGTAGRAGPAGTGLGLPIARELARRWDGEATLVNVSGGAAPGRG